MTRFQYQSSPTPPPCTAATTTGGSISSGKTGTWYFWIAVRARGGFTQFSPISSVVVAENDQIQITLPSAIRTTGSDVRVIYIIGSKDSNDPVDGGIVAGFPGYEADGVTLTTLPTTITLSTDEQLETAGTVTTAANLPTGGDLVNRMRRYVEDVDEFQEYILEDTEWRVVYPKTFNPNLTDTTGLNGINREARDISTQDILIEEYDLDGQSNKINFLVVNTSSVAIATNKRIGVAISINGIDASTAVSGQMLLAPLGLVELSTGTLDTLDQPAIGGSFAYEGFKAVLEVQKAIQPGWGYLFSVQLNFEINAFKPEEKPIQGSSLQIYAGISPVNAEFSPDPLAGDYVVNGRYVLPNGPSLMPIATAGSSRVDQYVATNFPAQDIPGLIANTAAQNIVITNNGTLYKADTIPSTARLRAIAGTTAGVGALVGPTQVTLSPTLGVQITVTNPTKVRDDYPDIVAGLDAVLNADLVYCYVQPTGGGDITQFQAGILGDTDNPEVLVFGNVAGTNIGTTLPTPASTFGLFEISGVVATQSVASVFTAGDYNIWFGYYYEDTLSEVTHDRNLGCINDVAEGTVIDAVNNAIYWKSLVTTAAIARTLGTSELGNAHYRVINGKLYQYFPNATGLTDDGINIIIPTNGGAFIWDNKTITVANAQALRDLDVTDIGAFEWAVLEDEYAAYLHTKNLTNGDDGDQYLETTGSGGTIGWVKVSATGSGGGGGSGSGINYVADLAALKAQTAVNSGTTHVLEDNGRLYRYDFTATDTGDDDLIIEPTDGIGRYFKIGPTDTSEIAPQGDRQYVTAAEKTQITTNQTNIATNVTSIAGKSDVLTSLGSLRTHDGTNEAALVPTVTEDGKTIRFNSAATLGIEFADFPTTWSAYATSGQSVASPGEGVTRTITLDTGSTEGWAIGQRLTLVDGQPLVVYVEITDIPSASQLQVEGLAGNPSGTLNAAATPAGLKITSGARGRDGVDAYGRSSQALIIPTDAQTRTIILTQGVTTAWFVNQVLTFTDSTTTALLKVTSINSSTEIEVTGIANKGNPEGSTINNLAVANGLLVTPGDRGNDGIDGADGVDGTNGINAYGRISSALIVPTSAETRNLVLTSGVTDAWFIGQILTYSDGVNTAYLAISAITDSTNYQVTGVDNIGNPEGTTLNASATANALIVTPGSKGFDGIDGADAYGRSSQTLNVPTSAQTRTVTLSTGATTAWFVNQILTFTDTTITALLKITSINSSVEFEVTGVDQKGNPEGSNINPGSATNALLITPGDRGDDGVDGIDGTDGVDAYGRSSQAVVIPTSAQTRTIILTTGVSDAWYVNQVLTFTDVVNKAYLTISSINSSTEIEVVGTDNKGNPEGTTLNAGATANGLLITPGDKGADGVDGTNGVDAYGRSSQTLNVPTSIQTRTVTLAQGSTSAWFVNQVLTFTDSTNVAFLKITSINSSTEIEVTGVDNKGNIEGVNINPVPTALGLLITPGDRGVDGTDGANGVDAYGLSSQALDVPSSAESRTITLNQGVTTAWFVNQILTFSDNTNFAYLKITAITNSTQFDITGVDDRGNNEADVLNSGATVNGLLITPGDRGPTGATGATGGVSSATTLTLTEQGSDPATPSTGDRILYAKNDGVYEIDDAGVVTQLFDDKQVIISSNDTTQGYLQDKIVVAGELVKTVLNEGTNESLEIQLPDEFATTKNFNATTLTDGANIAWDLSSNQVCSVTLAGDRTLNSPTNKVDGATYILIIKQDATGGRTLTFGSDYKFPGGIVPTLSTGANAIDIISFVSDGINLYGVIAQNFS